MDLMEYQARALMEAAGIPVPPGAVLSSVEDLDALDVAFPAVVKAQVPVGGRGKAGGVRPARDETELRETALAILGMEIRGHIAKKVLVAAQVNVQREMYLSLSLDRDLKKHVILFSAKGGVDIEAIAKDDPGAMRRLPIDPLIGFSQPDGAYLADIAGLSRAQGTDLTGMLAKMYALMKSHGCLLVEINPLAINAEGELVALDGKIVIDDAAIPRLPDVQQMQKDREVLPLVAEAAASNFLYIPCEAGGRVAVVSNGSGMLMSCIDHIARRGMATAAVLDLGGGATADRVCEGVRIILKTEGVTSLFVNVFGGITRCDEVAGGILKALSDGAGAFVAVRLEGTNREAGREMLAGLPGVTFVDSLREGVEALYEHTH